MKKISYSGLCDIWHDFTSTFPETLIKLQEVKIYQVKDVNGCKMKLLETDVNTMLQTERYAKIPEEYITEIQRIGVFYKAAKKIYIPTDSVRNRILGDYFREKGKSFKITSFSSKEDVICLAHQFQTVGSIYFISRNLGKGYASLVGMRAKHSNGYVKMDEILSNIKKHYQLTFYTDYLEQQTCHLNFSVLCRIENVQTIDGFPLYLKIQDNISNRKSVTADILVEITDKKYIFDTLELGHRTLIRKDLAEELCKRIAGCKQKAVVFPENEEQVETGCLKYIPKKMHKVFIDTFHESIEKEEQTILASAYNAMIKAFQSVNAKAIYKTQGYDMGKRKCELYLGSLL